MMTRKKAEAWWFTCACERCRHGWKSLAEQPPLRCPGCGSPYWNTERKYKRRTAVEPVGPPPPVGTPELPEMEVVGQTTGRRMRGTPGDSRRQAATKAEVDF